jgi:hypothetical protein
MTIKEHIVSKSQIAEIESSEIIIQSISDATDILGNIYYQGFHKLIIKEENLSPEFFDLKNGMAGEILQKFSNYRIALAIVGDFKKYGKKSIQDFIRESNRTGHILFSNSLEEALVKI